MPYKDKEMQREYQRNWMRKRRNDYFKDKVCEKCNSTLNLELHHLDPSIKESHKIWSWTEERGNKELEKCVVWCERCHNKHHMKIRSEIPIKHGTRSGYKRFCRCILCKQAESNYLKNYRFRKTIPLVTQ